MTKQQVIEKPQELPKQDQPQPEHHSEPQPAAVGVQLEPNPPPVPVAGNVSAIVQQLKQERERAQKEVQTLDAAITALGSKGSNAQPLQLKPRSLPAVARPAQGEPQPASSAANPAQPNSPSAPAAVPPGQAKPKPVLAEAKPPRSMARRIIVPLVVILILDTHP